MRSSCVCTSTAIAYLHSPTPAACSAGGTRQARRGGQRWARHARAGAACQEEGRPAVLAAAVPPTHRGVQRLQQGEQLDGLDGQAARRRRLHQQKTAHGATVRAATWAAAAAAAADTRGIGRQQSRPPLQPAHLALCRRGQPQQRLSSHQAPGRCRRVWQAALAAGGWHVPGAHRQRCRRVQARLCWRVCCHRRLALAAPALDAVSCGRRCTSRLLRGGLWQGLVQTCRLRHGPWLWWKAAGHRQQQNAA